MANQDNVDTDTITAAEGAVNLDYATTDTFYEADSDGGPNDSNSAKTASDTGNVSERFRVNKGSWDYVRPYRAVVDDSRTYVVIHDTREEEETQE